GATRRSPLHHHDREKPDYRFKSFAAFSPRILSFCFGVRSFRSRMVETVWGYSESKCGKSVAIKMWSSPTSFRDCVMSPSSASQVTEQLRFAYSDGAIFSAPEIRGKSLAHSQSSSMRCIQYSGHSALHSKKATFSLGNFSNTPPSTKATKAGGQFNTRPSTWVLKKLSKRSVNSPLLLG